MQLYLSPPTISKVFTAYSLLFFFFFLPTSSTRNRRPPFPGTGIAQMGRRNMPLCRHQKSKDKKQISFWPHIRKLLLHKSFAHRSKRRTRTIQNPSILAALKNVLYSIFALGKSSPYACNTLQSCRHLRRPELFRLSARQLSCNTPSSVPADQYLHWLYCFCAAGGSKYTGDRRIRSFAWVFRELEHVNDGGGLASRVMGCDPTAWMHKAKTCNRSDKAAIMKEGLRLRRNPKDTFCRAPQS